MRTTMLAALTCAAAGCASTQPDTSAVDDAIRFGVAACERHFLDGLELDDAVAASARGRSFARVEREFEDWTHDSKPWRLAGMDVWVGVLGDTDEVDRCEVLAVGGGSMALRDAIMKEHVARTDRAWATWPTGGGGRRAVCTTDRVPSGKSVLVVAHYNLSPEMQLSEFASASPPPRFQVTIVNEKVCDRIS
jgi:hypothetical protein